MTKDADLEQTLGITAEKGKWKRRAYWIVPVILLVVGAVIWGVHQKTPLPKTHSTSEPKRLGSET